MSTQEKETNVQTYSNSNITVHVTKQPHCQVTFDITVNQTAVEAAHQKALKTVSKEVSLPGFRKGKVPSHFIVEKYAGAIKEEFIDAVLQNAFNEALQLTHLQPLKDSIKTPLIKECSREKEAHFTISFESRLTPPSIHLDQIKVKRITPQIITESDRNEAIQQLLWRMSEFVPITDRAVQPDDFINLQVILFGELPKCIDNHRTQVKEDVLPNWLLKKVIGLNVGETVEGMTEPNNDLNEKFEELEDDKKPIPFKATVTAIYEAKAPELDDELIKKIGLESKEDLAKKMQERLEQTAVEEAFEHQTNLIERALLDQYSVDVPKSYLDAEFKIRLEEYLEPLLKENLTEYVETHRKSIEAQIKKISLERLSIYFMLHALAIKNQISPSQEEINQEFVRQRSLMSINRGSLSATNKEELERQLYNLAMEQKIKQFLLNNVTFIED